MRITTAPKIYVCDFNRNFERQNRKHASTGWHVDDIYYRSVLP